MQDWHYRWAIEALRVAKPGCIMLAFGGTRTHHRLACAIEDAGWEIRDTVMWVYGSGFPKSLDISKAIDKAAGAEREVVGVSNPHDPRGAAKYRGDSGIFATGRSPEGVPITAPATDLARLWQGWGTALKPAWEPIIVAMKPLDKGCGFAQNAEKWGVAGINVDGCRVGTEGGETHRGGYQDAMVGGKVARGGVDTDLTAKGRWPANLIHDGSEEVVGCFPVTIQRHRERTARKGGNSGALGAFAGSTANAVGTWPADGGGSAARFFQCCPPDGEEVRRLYYAPKAPRAEREMGLEGMEQERVFRVNAGGRVAKGADGDWDDVTKRWITRPCANHHPTVKPLALMRHLVRLTKTPGGGGLVLDPFMGSGTTGVACVMEGRDFVGIELSEEYCAIARARIAEAAMQGVLL
jgi:site-specific DNA-methyltransferase (adenine-specific)